MPFQQYPISPTPRMCTPNVCTLRVYTSDGFALSIVTHPNSPPVRSLTLRTYYPQRRRRRPILYHQAATYTQNSFEDGGPKFSSNSISARALKSFLRNPLSRPVGIMITPDHTGVRSNEAAHTAAQELNSRAGPASAPHHSARSACDHLLSYQEVTEHYGLFRRGHPPAHTL